MAIILQQVSYRSFFVECHQLGFEDDVDNHDDGDDEYLKHPLLQHDEAVVGLASDQHQQRLWPTCSKLQKNIIAR